MQTTSPKYPWLGLLLVLRWTARILGFLVLLLIAAFAVGEGVPNPLAQPPTVNLLFAAFLTMVVGLLVAWKWESTGGILILGGLGLFAVVNHGFRFNLVFGPILAVGLLHLLCGCLRNWMARPG